MTDEGRSKRKGRGWESGVRRTPRTSSCLMMKYMNRAMVWSVGMGFRRRFCAMVATLCFSLCWARFLVFSLPSLWHCWLCFRAILMLKMQFLLRWVAVHSVFVVVMLRFNLVLAYALSPLLSRSSSELPPSYVTASERRGTFCIAQHVCLQPSSAWLSKRVITGVASGTSSGKAMQDTVPGHGFELFDGGAGVW